MNNYKYFYNNEEVKLIYTHDNESWIKLEDGIDLVVSFNELERQGEGKFEHLRNLPIDTKVLVRDSIGVEWIRRYFSHVSDCGNEVFCFDMGVTSFTSENNRVTEWPFCKVYEE